MIPEKIKELVAIHPGLYSELNYGFECDEGWFDLIKSCLEEITKICERDKLEIKLMSVKEKYGELDINLDSTTDEIEDLIMKAKHKSIQTCEICGKPGKIETIDFHHFKTLCKPCVRIA